MLGYSYQVTQKHAAETGNTWAEYVRPNPGLTLKVRTQPSNPGFGNANWRTVDGLRASQAGLDIVDPVPDNLPFRRSCRGLLVDGGRMLLARPASSTAVPCGWHPVAG